MKKVVSVLLVLSLICIGIAGCSATPAAPSAPAKVIKIAYFVSDMRETFHQAQFAEAKKYAKEQYGAEVIAFDGKGDSNTMTANVDQIVAQGIDAATLHIWDNAAAMPGINAALDKEVAMASFFSPVPGSGIPVVRNDEAGISEAMGKEMATQWKAANPDKPIVMVQLGWPNHTEVKSGRTDPFVKGVLSVDPTATDLGCIDSSAGEDAAKQIIKDLCTQHPEVNLIYAESGGIARGVMAGLNEAGRGTVAADGKPTTELVCTCDFDEVQLKQMFDTNSSMKLSLALPPVETGRTRIDVLMDLINGKINQKDAVEKEYIAKAYLMSFYSTTRADDIAWLNTQFGLSLSASVEPAKVIKIAYFVSDMRETFHQAQFAEAKKYAKEKYGAEVIAFDGKGDSNTMTANVDQIVAQGMNAATLHIWDNAAAMPGINSALDKKVAMASFFSPVPGSGIPVVRNDEAGISFQMGVEMATQWKAANPDKPIVMVQLGWPNHVEVKSGRTDPFVAGVKSVDPNATDLGCQDSSAGEDAAKQIIKDLCTQHKEVNLIYAESGGIARGVMAGLNEAGRGTVAADGKPTTELVCTCDFDEVQLKQMFDTNSSLKLSLALPPVETGRTRIDVLMDLINGTINQKDAVEKEYIAKAYLMSFYSTTRADDVAWLNTQFGLSLQ